MKKLIPLILLLTATTFYASAQMGGTHGSLVTNISTWPNTTYFESLQLGVSNPLFIGGRSPSAPISWGAYPDATLNGPYHYYFSGNNVAKIQFDGWSGALLFDFNDPAQTKNQYDVVSWKTRMSLSAIGELTLMDVNGAVQFKVNNIGQVWARKVTVTLAAIPDYVFAKNYNLMPLTDVEKYILANKHLPNIKSADDYTNEKGVDVGEMQTKLLEKVEELTLYIIQQQKQIDELLACQKKGFAKASRKLKLAK